MKKRRVFLSILFLFFVSITQVACGNKGDFVFKTNSLSLSVEETIDLADYVELTNCSIEDILFKSSNENAVSIGEGHILVPSQNAAGEIVIISASLGDKYAILEVEVVGKKGEFPTPLNVKYDETTECVTWDKSQFVTDDNQNVLASDYTVVLTYSQNGEEKQEEVKVSDNKYQITKTGLVKIKVKANANDGYAASAYSDEITLTKLAEVENLTYNEQTKKLNWAASSGADRYIVTINGVGTIVENVTEFALTIDDNQKDITVVAASTQQSVYQSKPSKISLKRLVAPELKIKNGELSWNSLGSIADSYSLTLTKDNATVKEITDYKNTIYNFDDIPAGTYTVSIRANASKKQVSSVTYLSSTNESKLENIEKLKAPTLGFNNQTLEFSIQDANATTKLNYVLNDGADYTEFLKTDGKYVFDYNSLAGKYKFVAKNYATQDNQINSEYSNALVIEKLAMVNNLTQTVDANGNYIVNFDNKENYQGENLYVEYLNNGATIKSTDSWMSDSLFPTAGEYTITVIVNGLSDSSKGYFAVSNKQELKVVRIDDLPKQNVSRDGNLISWSNVLDAVNYSYKIDKINKSDKSVINNITSGVSTTNSYDLYSLDDAEKVYKYGTYQFSIKANAIADNNILYLPSKNETTFEFDVTEKIALPELSYDKSTKEIVLTNNHTELDAKYSIVCYNSENAQVSDTFAFVNNRCNISEFISAQKSGLFTFKVKGTNAQEELVLDSDVAEIKIEKLAAPVSFEVNQDETISVISADGNVVDSSNYLCIINDQEANQLKSDISEFTVKIKYLAKYGENQEEIYYEDSNFSEFKLQRFTRPNNLAFEENGEGGKYIKYTMVTDAKRQIVFVFEQNGVKQEYLPTKAPLYLSDIQIDNIDLNNRFDVYAYYKPIDSAITLSTGETEVETFYIKSFATQDVLNVNKQTSVTNLKAAESDEYVTISWDKIDDADVNYELYINGSLKFTGAANSIELANSVFQEAGIYEIKVRAINAKKLNSEFSTITVEKLSEISSALVSENEDVSAEHNVSLAKIEKIEYYVNDVLQDSTHETFNINKFSGAFTLKIRIKAKANEAGSVFYLSSNFAIYNLQRLETPNSPQFKTSDYDASNILSSYEQNKHIFADINQDANVKTVLVLTQNNIPFTFELTEEKLYLNQINKLGFNPNEQFSAYLYYAPKQDVTALDSLATTYLRSYNSSKDQGVLNIGKQAIVANITVSQEDSQVTISWDKAEGTSVKYELTIDGTREFLDTNTYVTTTKFAAAKVYNIKLRVIDTNKINGEYKSFIIEKLPMPSVLISKDEKLTLNHSINAEYIKSVYMTVAGNTVDANGEVSVKNIDGEFEVTLKVEAVSGAIGNKYILSSDLQRFTLKRFMSTGVKPVFGSTSYGKNGKYISVKLSNEQDVVNRLYLVQGGVTYIIELPLVSENETYLREIFLKDIQTYPNMSGFNTEMPFEMYMAFEPQTLSTTLSADQITYLPSKTETTAVVKEAQLIGLRAYESGDRVVLEWNAAAGENIHYELVIDGNSIFVETNRYEDYAFQEAKIYSVKVKALNLSSLDSEFAEISVERLNAPTITVSVNEELTLNGINLNKVKDVELYVNGQAKDYTNVNLKTQENTYQITAKLVAKQTENTNLFIISSKTATYVLNRIPNEELRPKVSDGKISWKAFDGVSSYRLLFKDGTNDCDINNLMSNMIDLTDVNVVNCVKKLNSTFEISVIAYVNSFVVKDNETHILSSLESTQQTVVKLKANQNIKVSATDDKEQKQVEISWDKPENVSTELFNKYIISVYKNNKSTLVEGFPYEITDFETTKKVFSSFTEETKYYVTIQTIGNDNVIYSDIENYVEFTRLNRVENVAVSPNGKITFNEVLGAIKYIVKLSSNTCEDALINAEYEVTNGEYTLTSDQLALNFADLQVSIIAIGDGSQTLSSAYSDVLSAKRLVNPTYTLLPDGIDFASIEEYSNIAYTYNLSIALVNSGNAIEVDNKNLSGGAKYQITDLYNLLKQNPEYESYLEQETKLIISVMLKSNDTNVISSLVSTANANKLATVKNNKFVTTQNNKETSILTADEVQNASYYSVQIGNSKITIQPEELKEGKIQIVLTDEILKMLSANFQAKIVANGGEVNGTMYFNSPEVSDSAVLLETVSGIVISPNGELTFLPVNLATAYKIEYKFYSAENALIKTSIREVGSAIDSLTSEELALDFARLEVKVYALGNLLSTNKSQNILSAICSETYVADRLAAPNFSLYKDRVEFVKNVELPTENYVYNAQILCDGEVVLSYKDLLEGTVHQVADYYEQLKNRQDLLLNEKVLTFKVELISNQNGVISSLSTQKSATKLKMVTDVTFVKPDLTDDKVSDAYSKTYLTASAPENASRYTIVFIDEQGVLSEYALNDIFSTEVSGGKLSLEITDEILSNIASSWRVNLMAIGSDVSEIVYFNSPVKVVLGTKLDPVQEFVTRQGKLVWSQTANATDYLIKLNNTKFYKGYGNTKKSDLQETFQGLSGVLTLNIKALGNITKDGTSDNIVLDSEYISDYTCTKIPQINNIRTEFGYFSLDADQSATILQAYVKAEGQADYNSNAYNLTANELKNLVGGISTQTVYTCEEIYNVLSVDTAYIVKIIAKSDDDNIIYSDFSEEIAIKIMPNGNASGINVEFADASVSGQKDYCKSYAKWDNSESRATNGYALDINGTKVQVLGENWLLDTDKKWASGDYNIKIATLGSSNQIGGYYYLTSPYSQKYLVTKLATPSIDIEIVDNDVKYSWSEIENAQNYYVLLDGNSVNYNGFAGTYANNVTDSFGTDTKTFERLEVCAVSKDVKYLSSSYGLYADENGDAIKILRPGIPEIFNQKDGSLYWDLPFSAVDLYSYYKNGVDIYKDSPVSLSIKEFLNKASVLVQFTEVNEGGLNNNAKYGPFPIGIFNLFKYSDIIKEEVVQAKKAPEGMPSLKFNLSDLEKLVGKSIPAGEYEISVKLAPYGLTDRGTKDAPVTYFKLGSAYNQGIKAYVANAPLAYIEYNPKEMSAYNTTNDSYYFVFNEIQLSNYSSYLKNNTVYYDVVLEMEDGTRVKLEEDGFYRGMTNSSVKFDDNLKRCFINLTDYIDKENTVLTPDVKKIFVYVSGEDGVGGKVLLDGKVSNIIDVQILGDVNAYTTDGILNWQAIPNSRAYKLDYTADGKVTTETIDECYFEGENLEAGKLYTNVKIKALGFVGRNSANMIISGKSVNIGNLTKLQAPEISVENSMFTWTNISNATGYTAMYGNRLGENVTYLQDVPVALNDDGTNASVYYQSMLLNSDGVCTYFFVSKGSTSPDKLNDSSDSYLNSFNSAAVKAIVLPQVTNFKTVGGKLAWDWTTIGLETIKTYKLTLTKVSQSGEVQQADIVLNFENENTFDCMSTANLYFENGFYISKVQAYYKTNESAKIGVYTDDDGDKVYYLIGTPTLDYQFQKLAQVKDISFADSTMQWLYDLENATEEEIQFVSALFNYKVEFMAKDDESKVISSQTVLTNEFKDIIEDILSPEKLYIAKISTVPSSAQENMVSSDFRYFVTKDETGEKIENATIKQLKGVNSALGESCEVEVKQLNGQEVISWAAYNPHTETNGVSENLPVKFEIKLSNSANDVEKVFTSDKAYIPVTEMYAELKIDDESREGVVINYQIRVIMNGNENYVPSVWSEQRSITTPKMIEKIYYDDAEQLFYWEKYSDANDITYIVEDSIVDEEGTVLEKYRYTISKNEYDEQEKQIVKDGETVTTNCIKYITSKQGRHVIAVAVMLAYASEDSGLTSQFKYYTNDAGTNSETIELFDNPENGFADGTENNPYLISQTADEEYSHNFGNIKYRLKKPAYQYSYKKIEENENGEKTETTITLSENDKKYYFKQTTDIVVDESQLLVSSQQSTYLVFDSIYDGQYKTLTWNYNIAQDALNIGRISLFDTIGANAEVKNVKIFANFSKTSATVAIRKAMAISYVAYNNLGKISNVVLGDTSSTFAATVSIDNSVFVGMVAYDNKNEISNVVNNYKIKITNTISGGIYVGGIVVNNYKKLVRCGNNNSIEIDSARINLGGIATYNNDASAVIEECFNNGNISINTTYKNANSINITVGGILGTLRAGTMAYCYMIGELKLTNSTSKTNAEVRFAGLIGYCDSATSLNVQNSYTKISAVINNYSDKSIYQLVGTYSNITSIQNVYYFANAYCVRDGQQEEIVIPVSSKSELKDSVKSYTSVDQELLNNLNNNTSTNKFQLTANGITLIWQTTQETDWQQHA